MAQIRPAQARPLQVGTFEVGVKQICLGVGVQFEFGLLQGVLESFALTLFNAVYSLLSASQVKVLSLLKVHTYTGSVRQHRVLFQEHSCSPADRNRRRASSPAALQ